MKTIKAEKIYQSRPRKGKRVRCPKCGKLGVLHYYPDKNFSLIEHTYKIAFDMIREIVDKCYIINQLKGGEKDEKKEYVKRKTKK